MTQQRELTTIARRGNLALMDLPYIAKMPTTTIVLLYAYPAILTAVSYLTLELAGVEVVDRHAIPLTLFAFYYVGGSLVILNASYDADDSNMLLTVATLVTVLTVASYIAVKTAFSALCSRTSQLDVLIVAVVALLASITIAYLAAESDADSGIKTGSSINTSQHDIM